MPGILVIGEVQDGGLAQVSGELLAVAGKLSDAGVGGGVQLALAGDDLSGVTGAAAGAGADRVYLLEHEALAMGGTGGYDAPVAAVTALCEAISPEVVLLGRTDFGAIVGPRVAYRLGAPLAQDCMDVAVSPDTGRAAVTRPVHGGNAMAVYVFRDGDPQIITIRPNTFDPLEPPGTQAEVEHFAIDAAMDGVRTTLIRVASEEGEGVRLEDADIIVSGGRGMGGPEPFDLLQELAGLLGGAVGASRAACDAGWVDHGFQVGLTGKSVAPRVYITVGISGASQHMAGISGAKNIVAINKDGDANIFRAAKYGVVGEWQKVLPSFIAAVRDLVG